MMDSDHSVMPAGETPDSSSAPSASTPDSGTVPPAPADLGPNPFIGEPPPPRERIQPPAVIHSLGDAHPGEANPAYAQDMASESGAVHTAEALAAREVAEEQIATAQVAAAPADSGVYSYEDTGAATLPRDEQPGGRPVFSGEGEAEPMEYMDSPHGHETLIGGLESLDQINARVDAKVEANANQLEHAESVSGLNFREGDDYERREFQTPMPERDDVLVGAGTGMSTVDPGPAHTITAQFANPDQAQAALQGLHAIGIMSATLDGDTAITAQVDRVTHEAVRRVFQAHGATAIHD